MSNAKEFILKIGPVIQKVSRARGYSVASAVIAQACIESAWGKSSLASKWFNFFGLKCGSSWKGEFVRLKTREEYKKGVLTVIRDNFRVYHSMEEGVNGYYDFISTKRYSNLKSARTPEEYLQMIKDDGYATDSTYVPKNMKVVNDYGLVIYDKEIKISNDIPKLMTKNGSRGPEVFWTQEHLNFYGYNLIVDGICGPKTVSAIKDFQKTHGLTVDGVAGPKTYAMLIK